MEVARTSICHAGASQFLWPQAIRYAAHQLNLWPIDARPRVTPVPLWSGLQGVAADFRVSGCLAHVRAPGANKLSPRTRACIFLGFPLDASGWVFYDPVTCGFFASQNVTFDESVCYYKSRPFRAPPPPLRVLPRQMCRTSLRSRPPRSVQSPSCLGVREVQLRRVRVRGLQVGSKGAGVVGVEVTPVEDTTASSRRPRPASPPGFPSVPQFPPHSSLRPVAVEPGGVPVGGTGGPGGVGGGGAGSGVARAGGTGIVGTAAAVAAAGESRGGVTAAAGEGRGGVMAATGEGRAGVPPAAAGAVTDIAGESRGAVTAAPEEGRIGVPPATAGAVTDPAGESRGGVTAAEGSAEVPVAAAGAAAVAAGEGRGGATGAAAGASTVVVDARGGGAAATATTRPPRPSTCTLCSWSPTVPSYGPFHLVLPSRVPPPPILPQPPESSLTVLHDPLSDYLRASRPVVSRVLSALVTHPTSPLSSVSALISTVAGFASSHRLDYAAHVVSGPARSPSTGGEPVFPLEVLEDRQFELGFLAAAVPHLCAMLLAPEGDPDALDIPIPRTHAEAVLGPWASYWIAAEEPEMASYRSTGTYVDAVPPPGTNVVSGRWLYKVKRPPGSPPVFKARYVARGFSQQEGVDFFQTFAPAPKMSTLRVLLHIAAQRDYELHSLDFSTAFLQGSLHEQIWLRRPPGFTGSFPPGTQWQLRRPVYGLRQAPREWHDTLCSTLAALDFFPSSVDPSLFVRRGSTPSFVLVYIDDLVFTTPDRCALASVKEELQRRHTCTNLGELQHYFGLQITKDQATRTITLTQSHMVEQILTRFRFPFSKVQLTPLGVDHGLMAPPSDESFESSGPYLELVGCLMYLMTCTRPDLAYPLSVLARFVAPGRHKPSHWYAAKRVASTSGMGLVLGGKQLVTLTGYSDSSWADNAETRRSTQEYSFSLGAGDVLWRSTQALSVAGSSCEAEVYAEAMAAQELRWLSFFLTDLGERPRSPPVLFADNRSDVLLCEEPRVVGKANTADIFTKALSPCDQQHFCTQLGPMPARPHLLT
ncbi:unnamed protein product [Closterium sp. NIES-54]